MSLVRTGWIACIWAFSVVLMSGCVPSSRISESGEDLADGYPDEQIDVTAIADAVPVYEARTIAGNKSPYTVFGETYWVMSTEVGYSEEGIASFYGTKFHGRLTSNGEPYDMFAMTAAHKSMPIPSYARVTNLENQLQVVVRINDRGPFHDDRIIDLSWAAARKLGFDLQGTAPVLVEAIPVEKPSAETSEPRGVSSVDSWVEPINGEGVIEKSSLSYPFLQVAAFSGYDSALDLRQRLARLLSRPAAVHLENSLYKVRVGPMESELDLEQVREELVTRGFSGSYLVFAAKCEDDQNACL